ncbi:RimK-like ATP-grasp domain-containing protein [Saccharothrix carnea]|uniref:RimK-like ATP-grasp domain-containing protein n=1 Tax=Saccharothrix carnea TaxID=1280637 RepID=A0A2P8HIE1_SACCR|nr:hypothetical protein [Saccharothrix carnea]PSL45982.1 RimK-like ATP-grasp domain-containing protein [Saccharothrix carnea]
MTSAPAIEEWGHAVLKPRRGCFGRGVLFIDNFTALRDVVGYLDAERGGGAVEYRDVPATHAALALRAQQVFGLPLLGLDIIRHEGEPIVVDVNTGPALYPELFAAAGRSLPHELHRVFTAAIGEVAGQPVRASGIR